MTKARGIIQSFEPTQVAGIDTRVWQDKGSSTDNRGVVFSLRGEVATVDGIRPLLRLWRDREGNPNNPFNGRITSVGTFSRDGRTDILVESNGSIYLLEGNQVTTLLSGRHIPSNLNESTRFFQVGTTLLLLNGRDPNMKWDGEKMTPLGISSPPNPPRIVGASDGATDINDSVTAVANRFWGGYSILKSAVHYRYQYKTSWVSEFGQESELSPASNMMEDTAVTATTERYMLLVAGLEGPPPQDDIIGRNLYRSVNGISYQKLRYLPGTDGDHYIDYTAPDAPLATEAKETGTNSPPPLSTFCFLFRGRTYYGGNEENPTVIFYSGSQGAKEAVAVDDFILLGSDVADPVTGYALSGDYALLFKERSTYMLTQDKTGLPIVTPLSNTIGAVSDKAAVGFEGRVYFVSESGLFAFDGSKVVPLSPDIASIIKTIPKGSLKNSFGWADPLERRVYFSIATGPSSLNNEVWAIHIDSGALSKTSSSVTAACSHKGGAIVGYNSKPDGTGVNDLGVWGCGTKVYYRNPTDSALSSVEIERFFETRWITLESPQSDKTFYRLDVFYVQTGGYQTADPFKARTGFDNRINVEWYTDWDRNVVGGTTLVPCDPEALLWNGESEEDGAPATWVGREGGPAGNGPFRSVWDEKRVRSRRISISANGPLSPGSPSLNTSTSDPSGEKITAKCIKLSFSGGGDAGWRVVGFVLHAEDHGLRGEGTDHE